MNYIDRFGLSGDLPPGYEYLDVPAFMFWGEGSGGFGAGGGGGGFGIGAGGYWKKQYYGVQVGNDPFEWQGYDWLWVEGDMGALGNNMFRADMLQAGIDAEEIRSHYALYYGFMSGIYGAGSRIAKDYEIGRLRPTDYGSRLKNIAAVRGNVRFWRGAARAALPVNLLLYGSDLYMASQSIDPMRGYYQATGSLVGGLVGGYGGAALGSLIPIPVAGTIAGGTLGAYGGAELGGWVGGKVYDWYYKR